MAPRETARKPRRQDHRTRVGRERSARTETRILEAALRVFGEMGPDAPRIDDFVLAAGVSRGTFYNYFESVEELLSATSRWMTRERIETVETALEGLEGPALRFGVGLRLFLAQAHSDPAFCRFVARVWKLGGLEWPERDLREGLRIGIFTAPSPQAASDLIHGAVRQALLRMGTEASRREHGEQMIELCLRALGTPAGLVAKVMKHELPSLALNPQRRRSEEH